MAQLDFLTVVHNPGNLPIIHTLLDLYHQQTGHTIRGNFANWNSLWRESTNAGIYNKGADFAEIGSTWLEGLVAMNSLRPYTPAEIEQLGGQDAFLPGSWSAVTLDSQVWGIPIRADARVLWYWKDMVEDAKLDPATAFSSIEGLPETFEALKVISPTPWAILANVVDANTMQVMASWLWQAGGDFISADGKKVLFAEPNSRRGMRAFFDLHRFMPRQQTPLDGGEINRLFTERKICATIGGPWLLADLKNHQIPTDRVGVTLIPGPAFVGGTLMVLYKHCRETGLVFDFLKLMLEPSNLLPYSLTMGLLPATRSAWQMEQLGHDELHRVLYQAISQGRSYPAVRLWGIVEQKMLTTLATVWETLLSQETPDIDSVIDDYIAPLARRLELTLNG